MSNGQYRINDPDTSVDAANAVRANKGEQECLTLVQNAGSQGITNTEAATMLGRLANATSPRWRPMVRKGLIRDSGLRRENSVSGRKEIVWIEEVAIA